MIIYEGLEDGADPTRSLCRLEEGFLGVQKLHVGVLDDKHPETALRELSARIPDGCRPNELLRVSFGGKLRPVLRRVENLSSPALMRSDLSRSVNNDRIDDSHINLFRTRFEGIVGYTWGLVFAVSGLVLYNRDCLDFSALGLSED
jgi:hypothetical protein